MNILCNLPPKELVMIENAAQGPCAWLVLMLFNRSDKAKCAMDLAADFYGWVVQGVKARKYAFFSAVAVTR
jgi:hypothetical protein